MNWKGRYVKVHEEYEKCVFAAALSLNVLNFTYEAGYRHTRSDVVPVYQSQAPEGGFHSHRPLRGVFTVESVEPFRLRFGWSISTGHMLKLHVFFE